MSGAQNGFVSELPRRWSAPRGFPYSAPSAVFSMEDGLEEAELSALYGAYGYLVHRRCLAITGNRADADDALQEVFLRVQRFHGSQSGESTLGWLYAIASNCCFDLLKRRGRQEPSGAMLEESDAGATGTPSDADRRALLGAVLRQLDEKTREIGILHHLDGFTQEEVATRTGYSRKTVGKKLQLFEALFKERWLQGGGGS